MRHKFGLLLLGCAALLSTNFARADTYQFTSAAVTFTLNSSPTPTSTDANSFYITGVNTSAGVEEIGFGQFGANSEFGVAPSNVVLFDGGFNSATTSVGGNYFFNQSFFTGPLSSPTFILGSYTGVAGILTITDLTPAATPEPSSLALLGTGVIGVAGVLRRRFVS